jgi:phosphoenolpyruvate carboxykinase (GTP)
LLENLDREIDNPEGVVVGGIIYGARDSDTWVPLEESFNWEHGIITKGASLESETTAATLGKEGVRKWNPMSNLDFLSIPIGMYIEKNIEFGKSIKKPPLIFSVNYFLKDAEGNFLNEKTDKAVWLKWMELRSHNEVEAIKTPTGYMPQYQDLKRLFKEVLNKDYPEEAYNKQFTTRIPESLAKIERITGIYKDISGVPRAVFTVLEEQKERLLDVQKKLGDYILPEQLQN